MAMDELPKSKGSKRLQVVFLKLLGEKANIICGKRQGKGERGDGKKTAENRPSQGSFVGCC